MKIFLLMGLFIPFNLFSQETNSVTLKNFSFSSSSSGTSSNGAGITCEHIYIKINGENQKTVHYNDKIEISFDDIKGLKKIGNQVYPKMALTIVNAKNEVVFSNPKLLDGLQGTELSPLQLFASFKANLDYENNNQYTAKIKITDAKGTGFFNYKYTFKVLNANFLNIKISDGVKAERIFIWNNTKKEILKKPVFKTNEIYTIVFENITGLNNAQSKVFPMFSMKLDNYKGHTIIDVDHLLSQYEKEGIDAASVAKNQITAKITFNKGSLDNPYVFEAKIVDAKSNKSIEVKAIVKVE